jgi:hypothetical protein
MFAGWLAQTAHAYPTWPIAVQQAEGPVLRIRKSRAPPTILDDMGPFGHTREIERPAPAPRSVADSTSVTAGEQCLKSVDRLGKGRTFPGDR